MDGTFTCSFTMEFTDELKSYFEAMIQASDVVFKNEPKIKQRNQWHEAKASAEEIEYEELNNE